MIELCPFCGSAEILWDYFEEEYTYWCGHCGRDLTVAVLDNEEYEPEEIVYMEEAVKDDDNTGEEDAGDKAEREPRRDKVPSSSTVKT
jgi:hypothetical protein